MFSKKQINIALYSIIVLVVIISIYFVLFSSSSEEDVTEPTLTVLSQDFSATAGEQATVTVNFSDNTAVTTATLHYRLLTEETWTNVSIMNKTYSWSISESLTENYAYFVTINDAAGNGPVGDPSINGTIYYTIYVLKNNTDETPDEEQTRYVFIEESTKSSCTYCPEVGQHLQTLKEAEEYPFYYVSMVQDHEKANQRLTDDYNLYANPTVYVDGGYQVIIGAKEKQVYEDAIQTALSRDTADITINVTAEKNNDSNQANLMVNVVNNENKQYTGTLKLYLTEIVSTTYRDYNGDAYHNAFITFLMNKNIQISSQSEQTFTTSFDTSAYEYPDNLRVYAVIFNNEKHQQYSKKPDNPFDAYYVDAADAATLIEGGNLPPSVGFISPRNGKIHFRGNIIFSKFTLNTAILFGRTPITIQATDPEGKEISKVELYLDNALVKEFNDEPYEWELTGPSIFRFKHTLKAIAFDKDGNQATDEKEIIAFILF